MVCGATAGETDAPEWHRQPRLACLKCGLTPVMIVVVGVCVFGWWLKSSSHVETTTVDESESIKMLKSMNLSSGLPWFVYSYRLSLQIWTK